MVQDQMSWTKLEQQATIAIDAAYREGTVIASKGLREVTLNVETGAVWPPQFDGRWIRIGGDGTGYVLSLTGPNSGMLDRPYEGADSTGAAYVLAVFRVPCPPDFYSIDQAKISGQMGASSLVPWPDLRDVDPQRLTVTTPQIVAWHGNFLEIWPLALSATAILIDYVRDHPLPADSRSQAGFLLRDAILREGVMADIKRTIRNDYAGASAHEIQFEHLLAQAERRNLQQYGVVAHAIPEGLNPFLDQDHTVPRGLRGRQGWWFV